MHIVEPHKFLSTVIAFYIFFFFSIFVSSKLWNLFKFLTPTGTQRSCQTSIFSPLISHPPNTTFLYYLPCPSNASPSVRKGRPDWCIHKIPLRKIFCFKNPKHQRVFHCHYSPTLLRQQSHVESLQIPKTQSHFLDFYLNLVQKVYHTKSNAFLGLLFLFPTKSSKSFSEDHCIMW